MLRVFVFSLVLFSPAIGHAACSNPTGPEGQIVYNIDHKKMQFCNGTIWKSMGASSQTINALEDVPDVKKPIGATDGQILTWDNANGEWIADDGVTSFQIPDDTSVCNAGTDGTIRYNSNKLQVCIDGSDWTDVGDGAAGGVWTKSGNDAYSAMSGNIGIGTPTPGNKLTVSGVTETDGLIITGVTGQPDATAAPSTLKVGDNVLACDSNRDGTLRYNGGSIQVCIDGTGWVDVGSSDAGTAGAWSASGANLYYNAGNVGIGTTAPTAGLHITRAPTGFGSVASLAIDTSGSTDGNIMFAKDGSQKWAISKDGPSDNFQVWRYSGGWAVAASIGYASGDFSITGQGYKPGGGSWTATSDARLKSVDGEYTAGLDEISLLRPVRFHYRHDNARNEPSDREFIGLVAQEAVRVMPELVSVRESDGYYDLDPSALNFALINAVQELKAANDNLAAKVDAQAVRIEQLEGAAR